MRLLALECSSLRGSVALYEGDRAADARLVGYEFHEAPNEHAERMLGLVQAAFDAAGWERRDVDKIAVGLGPGSFAGVRIGLALAQGLVLGLGALGLGVGSLRVIAAGLPSSDERTRFVVRDARRSEYFVAAYSASGQELIAPHSIPQKDVEIHLRKWMDESDTLKKNVVVGTLLSGFDCAVGDQTTEPDARPLGRIALDLDSGALDLAPEYVRGPDITVPHLPTSPLLAPRSYTG